MTDARYPSRWLTDRRMVRLSDPAHRLYVCALAWSVESRTDGYIDAADLALIPGVNPATAQELVTSKLWEVNGDDGWLITDYATTQTSAAQLAAQEAYRLRERERHRERRAASREQRTQDEARTDERGTHARAPEDRTGQARTGNEEKNRNANTHARPREKTEAELTTDRLVADLYEQER